MAEWLVEHGIGETRAALIERDRILEARIVPEGELLAGTVLEARLVARFPDRGHGVVAWAEGEAIVAPLPANVPEGGLTMVEIVRPAIPERGKPKRARARPAASGSPAVGPSLTETLGVARLLRHTDADALEAAGWSELLEEAATGDVRFAGGALTIALTPAMTLIDVDGVLPATKLALAGAQAAAGAIRRLDVAGSIGIDLPSAADRASRLACAEAIDAILPQPFERTAVNGFGFLQIVRRRSRRSIPELYAMEAPLAHARALLRRAERTLGAGPRDLVAHPAIVAELSARTTWIAAVEQRLGAPLTLRADPTLAISAGHVQACHP